MAKRQKVKSAYAGSAIDLVMDSNTKHKFENGWSALVTEVVTTDGVVEGTVLYIPGIDYKAFKNR